MFHGWSSFRKFSKKIFKFPKMTKIVPKSIQTCFGVIFSKKILRPVFHGWSSFRKFSKKIFKFPKMTKIVPKSIQKCFGRVLGQTFRKMFCPVLHGGSSLGKLSKKSKKKSNFQKRPKSSPKESKRVSIVFW